MSYISLSTKPTTILLIFLLLTACIRNKKLSKSESAWLPYIGNEILVFSSNMGEIDTIFLTGRDTMNMVTQNPFGIEYEHMVISCRHTDPWPPNGNHRYLNNTFVELQKTENGNASFQFQLSAKNAAFFKLAKSSIDSLARVPFKVINTPFRIFSDVYIIHTDETIRPKDNTYINKLYWSKSQGLVRYDKIDGVYWELTKKY